METDAEAAEEAAAMSAARRQVVQAAIDNDPLLALKDSNECTPLHLAIMNGARSYACVGRGAGGGGCQPWVLGANRDQQQHHQQQQQQQPASCFGTAYCLQQVQHPTPHHANAGHVECLKLLIHAKARIATACDGCPPLIMAVCWAALAARKAVAVEMVQLLLDAGADVMQRWVGQTGSVHARSRGAGGLHAVAV